VGGRRGRTGITKRRRETNMENDANKRVLFDYYWYLGDEAMDEYREEAELNG